MTSTDCPVSSVTPRLAALAVALIATAGAVGAQPTRSADRPTRIAIAAGTVTDAQSRAGLVGTWEPDADLGAAPGANQLTYFADGVYLSPLRNIALVGLWDATTRSLTLTPLEVRNLDSALPVPEMKAVLAQIVWGRTETSTLTWVDPDRYRESGSQFGRRRVAPARDLGALHLAVLTAMVSGTWVDDRGVVVSFLPGGLYREYHRQSAGPVAVGHGFHRFDAGSGALHVTIERVEAEPGAPPGAVAVGARPPLAVRVAPGDVLDVAGSLWRREKPYVRGAGGAMR
jgi:hypothetical protein